MGEIAQFKDWGQATAIPATIRTEDGRRLIPTMWSATVAQDESIVVELAAIVELPGDYDPQEPPK